uniref:Uncharacterized protein n=1 Tax=Panagrolaimus davidi TaxID=227884 RepID=A0A914QM41_9BILA
MFGRAFLLSTFIVAVILVSTLNAIKCNTFQLQKGVKPHESGDDESKECVGCTGYVCKIDGGKTILGSACTEDVNDFCHQDWDDSKIQSIAKNEDDGYESVNGEYFVLSCQEDNCNSVHWFSDNLIKHDKVIASAGLSHQKRSHLKKGRGKDIAGKAEKTGEHVVEGGEKAAKAAEETVQETQKAGESVVEAGKEGKKAAEETVKAAEETAKAAEETVQETQKAAEETQKAGESVAEGAKEAEKKTEEAAEDVIDAEKKAAGAVKDALGGGAKSVGYGIGVMVATVAYFFL